MYDKESHYLDIRRSKPSIHDLNKTIGMVENFDDLAFEIQQIFVF